MTMTLGRSIPDRLTAPPVKALKSWEALLALVALAVFTANAFASPYFLDPWNLSDASFNFTEKALIAFAMALLIIAGEIDLSVASIIALISFSGLLAGLLILVLGIDPLTAYLSTSPGGLDSIAVIAASSKVDVAFVMTLQTARLILVTLIGPWLARFVADRS